MRLVAVGPTPGGVGSVAGDRDALHRALGDLGPSNGAADLSAALALAAGLVTPGDDARAYLFSDGIVGPIRTDSTSSLPFPVEYHRIGVSGEKIGLTSPVGRTRAQAPPAFLHVQNFDQQ